MDNMPISRRQEKPNDSINQSVNRSINSTCDYVYESDNEEKLFNKSINATKLYEPPSTSNFQFVLESQIKKQQKIDFFPLNSSLNLLEESREANNLFCKSTKYLIGMSSHRNKSLTSENLYDEEERKSSSSCVGDVSKLNLHDTLFKSSSALTSKSSSQEHYENQQEQRLLKSKRSFRFRTDLKRQRPSD